MSKFNEKVKKKYTDHKYILPRALNARFHSTDGDYKIVENVNNLNPKLVIDVGCGYNYWKNKIHNLIGIDIADYGTNDITCSISEAQGFFGKECADVVLNLGTLNNGDWSYVHNQLQIVSNWLKPGGHMIMRVRSDWADKEEGFHWTPEIIMDFTKQFKYKIVKQVELRYEILEKLKDDELQEYLGILKGRQIELVKEEIMRRTKGQPTEEQTMFKAKYCWWWRK
tara:strand:+ start:10519 stop:11193 length:675 start_codon:yes stop_codon:yes gene_type:complete